MAETGGAKDPSTPMDVIAIAFGDLSKCRLLDIGCGPGALARALVKRGAQVDGIDPNEPALAVARRDVPEANFHAVPGENLPFEDGTFDGAIFLNSLHHIPETVMVPSLVEAGRVCKPGAAVVIIEPLAEGSNFEVVKPIDDETVVRRIAQEAIQSVLADGVFQLERDTVFDRVLTYDDVEAIVDHIVMVDPERRAVAERNRDAVAAAVETYGEKGEAGITLRQPLRAHILRKSA